MTAKFQAELMHVELGEKVANRISDSRFFITRCNDDRALNSVVIRAAATVCRTKVGQRRQTLGPLASHQEQTAQYLIPRKCMTSRHYI